MTPGNTLRTVLPLAIALVIPIFFVLIYLVSSYHKLVLLRRRCQETRMRLERWSHAVEGSRNGEGGQALDYEEARGQYEAAADEYNRARHRGVGRWLVMAGRFAAADPRWPEEGPRGGDVS